jgi:hypothetical protein
MIKSASHASVARLGVFAQMIIWQFFAQDHAGNRRREGTEKNHQRDGQRGQQLRSRQRLRLLAQNVEHDLPPVRRAAMLEQIDALPSPEDHPPRGDRNGKLRLR